MGFHRALVIKNACVHEYLQGGYLNEAKPSPQISIARSHPPFEVAGIPGQLGAVGLRRGRLKMPWSLTQQQHRESTESAFSWKQTELKSER